MRSARQQRVVMFDIWCIMHWRRLWCVPVHLFPVLVLVVNIACQLVHLDGAYCTSRCYWACLVENNNNAVDVGPYSVRRGLAVSVSTTCTSWSPQSACNSIRSRYLENQDIERVQRFKNVRNDHRWCLRRAALCRQMKILTI